MKYLFLLDFDKTIIDFDSYTRIVLLCTKPHKKIIFLLLSILHKLKLIDNFKLKFLVNSYVFNFLDKKNRSAISEAIKMIVKDQEKLNFIDQLPQNSEIIIVSATYGFIVKEFISKYKLYREEIKVLGNDFDFYPGYLKGRAVKQLTFENNLILSNYINVVSYSDSMSDKTFLEVANIFYLVKKGKIIDDFKS